MLEVGTKRGMRIAAARNCPVNCKEDGDGISTATNSAALWNQHPIAAAVQLKEKESEASASFINPVYKRSDVAYVSLCVYCRS